MRRIMQASASRRRGMSVVDSDDSTTDSISDFESDSHSSDFDETSSRRDGASVEMVVNPISARNRQDRETALGTLDEEEGKAAGGEAAGREAKEPGNAAADAVRKPPSQLHVSTGTAVDDDQDVSGGLVDVYGRGNNAGRASRGNSGARAVRASAARGWQKVKARFLTKRTIRAWSSTGSGVAPRLAEVVDQAVSTKGRLQSHQQHVKVCFMQMRSWRDTWKFTVVLLVTVVPLAALIGALTDAGVWDWGDNDGFFTAQMALWSLFAILLSTVRTMLLIIPGRRIDDTYDLVIFLWMIVLMSVFMFAIEEWSFSPMDENDTYGFRSQIRELTLGEEMDYTADGGWSLDLESVATVDEMWTWVENIYVENILSCGETRTAAGDCILGDGKFLRTHASRFRVMRLQRRIDPATQRWTCGLGTYFDDRGWDCFPEWTGSNSNQNKTPIVLPNTFNLTAEWSDGDFVTFNGKKASKPSVVGWGSPAPLSARIGYYNESGYTLPIPDSWSNDKKLQFIQGLKKDNIVDLSARYVAFETVLVAPSTAQQAYVLIQFEIAADGALHPSIQVNTQRLPVLNCDSTWDWDRWGIRNYAGPLLRVREYFDHKRECTLKLCNATHDTYLKVRRAQQERAASHGTGATCPTDADDSTRRKYRYAAGLPIFTDNIMGALLLLSQAMYFILEEVEEFLRLGIRKYIAQGWNILDLGTGVLIILAESLQLESWSATPGMVGPDEYLSIRTQLDYGVNSRITFSVAYAFMWFKISKYLQFIKPFRILGKTIEYSIGPLASFIVLLSVFFVGFSLSFYYIFGLDLHEYRSMFATVLTLFRGLNGDMDVDVLMTTSVTPAWGFLAYIFFVVIMVFVIFTMLIAIISEAFVQAADDVKVSRGKGLVRWLKRNKAPVYGSEKLANVRVGIFQARDLRPNDGFLGSNTTAYVKVFLAGENFCLTATGKVPQHVRMAKTKTVPDSTNPVFKARISFEVGSSQADRLLFYVFDEMPSGRDLLLGVCRVMLSDLRSKMKRNSGKVHQMKLNLKPPRREESEVLYTVKEKPQGSILIAANIRETPESSSPRYTSAGSGRKKSTGITHVKHGIQRTTMVVKDNLVESLQAAKVHRGKAGSL